MKFELTTEKKTINGRTLYRIRALIDFGTVKKGTLGGWLEVEKSLSQEGEGWVGGEAEVYKYGTIWGGTIKGGTIKGGTIWGGTIEGGTIKGGTIWGGTIEGGTIKGGTIWGGTIKGGTIWGGTIEGGTIKGGTIWGGTIKKDPMFVAGLKWQITITEESIQIGCERHAKEDWEKFNTNRILKMAGKESAIFWKSYKKMILSLAKDHAKIKTEVA